MALSENKWFIRFWYEHGDRLIYMAIATGFGLGFLAMSKFTSIDMVGEAKVILIGVATLAFNKSRGVMKKDSNG